MSVLNDKVVDSSLVILGALQIYSMFLPDVTSVNEKTPEVIRHQEIEASLAVGGLAILAAWLTKSAFPAYVAIGTGVFMVCMYERQLRKGCNCGEGEY